MTEPDRLLVPHVDHGGSRFQYVGRYGDGGQFLAFVTGAFPRDWWNGARPPEYLRDWWREHKRWYAVLHRFGPGGEHVGTDARSGGTTASGEREAIDRSLRELDVMLGAVSPYRPCDIRVKPFGVEIDGYFFGLVYVNEDADDPDDPGRTDEDVMLHPNDIMFHPPWDSGDYSS